MTATQTAKLREIDTMAHKLLAEHGLASDWRLVWNSRVRVRAGMCYHRKCVIELGVRPAVLRTVEDTRLTILHEIAHALVGSYHGHDRVWRAKCLAIGGNGEVHYDSAMVRSEKNAPWIGTCPKGHTTYRFRMGAKALASRYSCTICHPRKFDERYLITWTRNPRKA